MSELIYTTKGDLPIESLVFSTTTEDAPTYTKIIETYTLDGEVVKQSATVNLKQGWSLSAIAGQFPGA